MPESKTSTDKSYLVFGRSYIAELRSWIEGQSACPQNSARQAIARLLKTSDTLPEIDIGDETVTALWDGLALELKDAAAASGTPHAFLEVSRSLFLGMLSSFPEDVLACVPGPALGAGKTTLGIGLSGTFKRYLAATAQDIMDITHGSTPSLSRGRAARPN